MRIPVAAGFNDDCESMESIASVLAGMPEPVTVELLQYHDLEGEKYSALGRKQVCYVPCEERMTEFAAALSRAGLHLTGGYR